MSYHGSYDNFRSEAPPSPHFSAYNPPRSPVQHSQPDLDSMPPEAIPLSREGLPPGARQPRFYGLAANDDSYNPRASIASSSEFDPRAQYGGGGYQHSEYGSVSRLPIGSAGQSTATLVPPGQMYQNYYKDNYYKDEGYQSDSVPMTNMGQSRFTHQDLSDKRDLYASPAEKKSKAGKLTAMIGVGVLVVAAAVVIPLYFFVFRHKSDTSTTPSSNNTTSSNTTHSNILTTGGDGSIVTLEDGTNFTYHNSFGGFWVWNPDNPFNNSAQPQSWSPPLSQQWNWGVDTIRGVNLGGWLNTEPFITPALYEKYQTGATPAIDEYTLCQNMANDTASGGLSQLENHYATFITETDFAQIAAAGLNFVRIPVGYWAIETYPGEPFLEGTSWKYFLKAIGWARKYGLRINLDLHALPGSQNGFNHSGKGGSVGFLNGVMGIANAQRSLNYIRYLAEFVSQDEYSDVIVVFGVVNEVLVSTIGQDNIGQFYLLCHDMIRGISGRGQGNGPFISIGEGFIGLNNWAGWFSGSDRILIDLHPYLCFGDQDPSPITQQVLRPCPAWGPGQNASMSAFGMTIAGEFSLGFNDCGLWVNGVSLGTRYDGTFPGFQGKGIGSCDQWTNWQAWDQPTKAGLMQFALASMDALQQWFFWNWKIGNSSVSGTVEAPFWSYQLGLQEGFMPPDPRDSVGICQQQGVTNVWTPPLQSWQTGGAGAGTINPTWYSSLGQFPPTTLPNIDAAAITNLPTYTGTGSVITLPPPTYTPLNPQTTIDAGDGWKDPQDTAPAYAPVAGCPYLDPWSGVGAPIPSAPCPGAAPAPPPKRHWPLPTAVH